MNALEPRLFQNPEFKVRSVFSGGEAKFLVVDLCEILGHKNPSKAVQGLHDDEVGELTISYPTDSGDKRQRRVLVVNESGLYTLILRSRKPAAQAFRRWVTGEVLPAIRKYGFYQMHSLSALRLKEVEADAETQKEKAVRAQEYLWQVQIIEGNCSIHEFLVALGFRLSKPMRVRLAQRARYTCAKTGLPLGKTLNKPEPRADNTQGPWPFGGASERRTYPPAVIVAELQALGYPCGLPSEEALAKAKEELLPRTTRSRHFFLGKPKEIAVLQ
jgi:prophage antirepressor-like protein